MARRRQAATGRTSTPLLEFTAAADFTFSQRNTSPAARQTGQSGRRYLTSSQQFANQALVANPTQFRIVARQASLKCLPPEAWKSSNYRGKRVLFLLPSQALGNNVATLLFLHAFADQCRPAAIGVFCARAAADIYLSSQLATVYTIWIGRRELKGWQTLIDLGQLATRRNIEFWPVEMESELLAAFGLEPSPRFSPAPRPLPGDGPLNLGVLPLASSPLRSLPAETTLALAHGLAPFGTLTVCLNRYQHQGVLQRRALAGRLPDGTRVIEDFASIGALMETIAGFDYAVFADSGPAHMAKLSATPGVAVYSSAPGDVLQGRFRNLRNWTVPWHGPHCRSPCGLAKIRQTADGRVGCMGSLGVGVDDLPATPSGQDPGMVERLTATPVPCIAELAKRSDDLVAFVVADLLERRSDR